MIKVTEQIQHVDENRSVNRHDRRHVHKNTKQILLHA